MSNIPPASTMTGVTTSDNDHDRSPGQNLKLRLKIKDGVEKGDTRRPYNSLLTYRWTPDCANCQEPHQVRYCHGPVDKYGFIPGCGACNSGEHITEDCTTFILTDEDLFSILAFVRHRKPPLRAYLDIRKLPGFGDEKDTLWHPWTANFAILYENDNPDWYLKANSSLHHRYREFQPLDPIWYGKNLRNIPVEELTVPLETIGMETETEIWNKIKKLGDMVMKSSISSPSQHRKYKMERHRMRVTGGRLVLLALDYVSCIKKDPRMRPTLDLRRTERDYVRVLGLLIEAVGYQFVVDAVESLQKAVDDNKKHPKNLYEIYNCERLPDILLQCVFKQVEDKHGIVRSPPKSLTNSDDELSTTNP